MFGCLAHVYVNKGKLESRAKKCVFMAENVMGHRLWCPHSKSSKFLILRYATFDESVMLKAKNVAPKPISKENETIRKNVKFKMPVQEVDKDMSHQGTHLEEEEEDEQPYVLPRDRTRKKI